MMTSSIKLLFMIFLPNFPIFPLFPFSSFIFRLVSPYLNFFVYILYSNDDFAKERISSLFPPIYLYFLLFSLFDFVLIFQRKNFLLFSLYFPLFPFIFAF